MSYFDFVAAGGIRVSQTHVSCILTLLFSIKPFTSKAYDRRASSDCGTSGGLAGSKCKTFRFVCIIMWTVLLLGQQCFTNKSCSCLSLNNIDPEMFMKHFMYILARFLLPIYSQGDIFASIYMSSLTVCHEFLSKDIIFTGS